MIPASFFSFPFSPFLFCGTAAYLSRTPNRSHRDLIALLAVYLLARSLGVYFRPKSLELNAVQRTRLALTGSFMTGTSRAAVHVYMN